MAPLAAGTVDSVSIVPVRAGSLGAHRDTEFIFKDGAARPSSVEGPLLWNKGGLTGDCIINLTEEDLAELSAALSTFQKLGHDGDKVSLETFPLPFLGEKLKQGAANVHRGEGVLLIHGISSKAFSVEDSVTVYLGISSYIADKRGMQNRKGHMLSHVTDSKLWTLPREQRHGIHTNGSLPFHNDMGVDVLALQVRACADQGGSTYLASAWSIYNDLVVSDPEALNLLFSPTWPIQVSGRRSGSRYILAPLMQFHADKLLVSVDPARLGPQVSLAATGSRREVDISGSVSTTRRDTEIPVLTAEQNRALGALLASAARLQVALSLSAGDILFLNNWAILHRRDAYTDGSATARHLVRLWLRNSALGWAVPPGMVAPWLATFENTPDVDRVYPIEPMVEYKVPAYSAGSAAFVLDESDDEASD